MKRSTTSCCNSTMANIMGFDRVASSDVDDFKICFANIRSLCKTSDKNHLAKKILLRQKRYDYFEGLLRHLGTLESVSDASTATSTDMLILSASLLQHHPLEQ